MTAVWHGRDWQEYCILLLQKRYAAGNTHSLQLVPDRHQGDLGIEAFSHDGVAYQCYAAEEPCSVNERYEKQRDKLTADLSKLKKNETEFVALFGAVVIHRYVFLVHQHDSRKLIPHANAKAQEVLGWGLPFIAPSFSIIIETDNDYANERVAIHAIPQALVGDLDLTGEQLESWATENQGLRGTALTKLSKLSDSAATRERVLEALTEQYLHGENALDRLRTIAPEVHRGVLAARAAQEDLLVLEYPPQQNATQTKLVEIAKDFATKLHGDFPVLNTQLATTLAWSAVADWLMRCPLDFEAPMSDIDDLIQFFEEAQALPRFSRRAVSIPGDFRTAWRLNVLCLLLGRGRARSLALDHLHVLWWAIRSQESRDLFLRWLAGEKSPDELLVRFDPSLTVTLDLAQGTGLVRREASGTISLTATGQALAASAANEGTVLSTEKAFLAALPQHITQRQIRELLEWS